MKQQRSLKRSSFRMRISRRIHSGFIPVLQQDSDPDSTSVDPAISGAVAAHSRIDQIQQTRTEMSKRERAVRRSLDSSKSEVSGSPKAKQDMRSQRGSCKYSGSEPHNYDLTVDSRVELGFSFRKKRQSFGSESMKRRGERFQRREIEKRKTIIESDEAENTTDSEADSHVCDFRCPLITHGQCPNSRAAKRKVKGQRRSSFTQSTLREASLISTTAAFSRPRPLVSLSIDDIPGQEQRAGLPMRSPGLLSISSMWSTSDLRRSLGALARPEQDTVSHVGTASLSNFSGSFSERMHELVRAFSSRTQRAKEKLSQPPTPSSESDYDAKSAASGGDEPQAPRNIRLGSFMPSGSRTSDAGSDENHFVGVWHCKFKTPRFIKKLKFPETMEPHNKVYVSWLFLVSLAFLYNAVVIPLRGVFPYQTSENLRYWLIIDYICDVIYILDIIIFKCRLRFTNNGIIESDPKEAKRHYMRKWMFKFDVVSLVPLDFFYFIKSVGVNPWLRLPRVLKIQTYWEFYERCDQASKSSAHAIRIIKTVSYMLFLIHVETCGYYAMSVYEGLGTNEWVYSGEGVAYIRCFYLATKTATSIGNNPTPTNKLEYIFMTFYWLSGVFLFALLIGQIRDIVEAATLVKDNYRKKMDSCLWYMQSINLPKEMKDRVREWFLYNWEQQKTIDERSLVSSLPKKLQTDLAINVHFNTLSKVQLFQDCERNLLYDLVLKLRPILYLPGDFICKKGEVGREMYIVTQGQVEVVGGEDGETVLATLHEGSVFGEISLLAMSGRGNRRTADVRSKGYTNVFTLSKHDFETAMTEYPDAQALLKRRAKKLLKANEKMEKKKKLEAEEIIKTPPETPKLLQTVIQIMDPDSNFVKHLTPSLRRSHRSLRVHSRSHSHRLSASASNIHHLTPPRSHSFRLPSQPANCPPLTPDPPACPRKDSFDTDDDNDDDVFDDSSDDVSLSEVLHNALANSSFDDSDDEDEDDDDDDDDGGDKELLIERYGTNFKQGKQPRSRQSPQRQAESSIGCEKEDRRSTAGNEQGCGENGNVDKELLKKRSDIDVVQWADNLETGDNFNSDSPARQRRDTPGHQDKKDDSKIIFTQLDCSPYKRLGNLSNRNNIEHKAGKSHQENQTNNEAKVNSDKSDRDANNFSQEVTSTEIFAENISSGDVNKTENVSKSKSIKLALPNLNLADQAESSQEGVGGRVRKLSVVSPPVSPVSPKDKQNTSWSSGRTQFVSLKESSPDLIMRCFTPVETPTPSQLQTHLTAEYAKTRTSPDPSRGSPMGSSSPVITNGHEVNRARSQHRDSPMEHRVRSPHSDAPMEHSVRSPHRDAPMEHRVRSPHRDAPMEHSVRSPLGDVPVEHRVRSPPGDTPAENRVTFSVEVHRQKSANSSTTDIQGHLETTL